MSEVITFEDFENLDMELDGDVLVMRIDLTKDVGETKKGFRKFAGTAGIQPLIAGERKLKLTMTLMEA